MKEITKKKTQLVRKLGEKKWRDSEGLYIIEGPNLIEEAIKYGAEIEFLVSSREDNLYKNIADTYHASEDVFAELADTETPQGVLAVVRKSKFENLSEKMIVLDRVQDPGNVGSILRTAHATGFGIMHIKGSADIYSPKVVRTAAGALFDSNIVFADDTSEALDSLAEYAILVADMEGDQNYYDVAYDDKQAIIVGNEGNGVNQDFLNAANLIVKIPMINETESLNVSIAAAILMFEAIR